MNAQELKYVPGEFLIKPISGTSVVELSTELRSLSVQDFHITAVCSTPFPIYLIQTNAAIYHEYHLLEKIQNLSSVEIVQFNHFVKDRLLPNDPQFSSQWQYINVGNNGGTPNADLDADLAWDITTGGLTNTEGDTIVVCMIDEGIDPVHPDLNGNLWFNYAEIPNNNIDDDENGYIDDYSGWNVASQNDNLTAGPNAGWHGTPVAGIIGARGNNAIGVTGINWNVKVMTVVRGATVAETLQAYAYPFDARKKYNESEGAQGAFVVATNSSWGIDFGLPEEAPLWCAFYDSLGTVGILNSASTVNGNYNVDQVGDLPTACSSEFLISVTNINSSDQKNINAGYGATSIDLGAYGTEIWTAKKNNSYGNFTGTSAAAPAVAGAIALLYSAPCPDISWYAKSNPSATAQLIKSYLINGVSPISSLSDITLSGGRLNLKSSLDLVMEGCAFTDCFAPAIINQPSTSETFAAIAWLNAPNSDAVAFRYRSVGSNDWIDFYNATSPLYISGLTACTTYEYQLSSSCGSEDSGFTDSANFQTTGCCLTPSGFEVFSVASNTIELGWTASSGVEFYNIKHRAAGSALWEEWNSTSAIINVSDLEPCTEYELQVQANCNNGTTTSFSDSFIFQTSSCDNCTEYNYCPISIASSPLTWISYIQMGDLENTSEAGINGYSDFTNTTGEFYAGVSYDLTIETGFDFLEIPLYFEIWLDLNQNGTFDSGERILESIEPASSCLVSVHLPINAISGTTRMRIIGTDEPFGSCGEGTGNGEVEDYCITIVENTTCLPPQGLNWSVSEEQVTISWFSDYIIESFEIRYRAVNQTAWQEMTTPLHLFSLENLMPCTEYEFQLRSECNGEHSLFTPLQKLVTLGCGSCLDLDYCEPIPGDTDFEWIAKFSLHSINQESGAEGYANFENNTVTELILSNSYQLEITQGHSGDTPYEEFYTVWIDFNQDGTFSDLSEKVFQTPQATAEPLVQGTVNIPSIALEGSTRLRVSMTYYAPPYSACGSTPYFGETEDYCISIRGDLSPSCSAPFEIFTTEISDTSSFIIWEGNGDAVSYQLRYRQPSENWTVFTNPNNELSLNSLLPCTAYEYQIRTICTNGLSAYSATQYFETSCLATAIDSNNSSLTPNYSAFPNPFEETIFINCSETRNSVVEHIIIFNAMGEQVKLFKAVKFTDEKLSLNLTDLAAGVYFISIENAVLKIVKM